MATRGMQKPVKPTITTTEIKEELVRKDGDNTGVLGMLVCYLCQQLFSTLLDPALMVVHNHVHYFISSFLFLSCRLAADGARVMVCVPC